MSEVEGTIALFTIDRIAYSPSPPITFAVVDCDGGGRLPVELTDVDVDDAEDRRPGRDDVPQAVHLRRDPQLLLEGPARPRLRRRETRMGSHGIKDRVAIVGMGCTPFGEHWNKGTDDLLIDAARGDVRVGRHRPRTTSTRTGSAPRCRA